MIPALSLLSLWLASARAAKPASSAQETSVASELGRIRDAALEDDYTWKQLAHLSHNIGPRLSGSAQAAKAVEYVAQELRALGARVTLEKAMVSHWVRGVETGELVRYPGQAESTPQKVVLTALGGSAATPAEGLLAPVVVVRSMGELAALGEARIRERIVLFNVPFDRRKARAGRSGDAYHEAVYYRAAGASAAARLGAVASLIRSVGGADYRLPHTGAVDYSTDAARIPAGAVASEDAEMIADLAAQGEVTMRLVLTPRMLPDVPGYNVVADLPGAERPEQVVLVSGHLDSWDLGTGSIDDGAGVAEAMETLRLVHRLGLTPKRTLRAVAWMNEENGAQGARAYAEEHKAEAADHVVAIESDSGAGHALGIKAHMTSAALALLQPALTALAPIGANIAQRTDEAVETDVSFLEALGVPGVGLLNDGREYFDYHHTAADTLDKIDPRELRENAAVMATVAWAAANLPDVLPRATPRAADGGR